MPKLVTSQELTAAYSAFEIEAPDIARAARPGHVVMFRPHGANAPIPCAITDVDAEKGTITIVVSEQALGETGDSPVDVTGPLGKPAAPGKAGKILCIAEGLGVAALLPRVREFKKNGWYTQVIAGYASKLNAYWTKRLDEFSDELYIVTEDGSLGIKGPIRHTIRAVCEQTNDIDRVLAVGPIELLKITVDIARKHEIPASISVNAVFDANGATRTADSAGDSSAGAGAASTGVHEPAAVFNWNDASDLDGNDLDFEDLMAKLGIQTTK
ncbi:MAG: hypothetical protein P8181_01930 [bacterium]